MSERDKRRRKATVRECFPNYVLNCGDNAASTDESSMKGLMDFT